MDGFIGVSIKGETILKPTLPIIVILFVLLAFSLSQYSYADQHTINFDNNDLQVTIDSPSSVVVGKQFTINFVLSNQISSERDDMVISVESQSSIIPISENQFSLSKLSGYGSYAKTMIFQVLPNATVGTQYINMNFSNNATPSFYNYALPIEVAEKPTLQINIITPDSIFGNAEFPFQVTVEGEGTGLHNATIMIIPPQDITFRGETLQTFADVEKNSPISMTARLITNNTQVDIEHHIPFQVVVDYTDDSGEKKHQSATTSIILRPRSMFELGSEGGFWIGNTYFSPTVDTFSIVIAVVVPLGIWIYKKRKKKPVTV